MIYTKTQPIHTQGEWKQDSADSLLIYAYEDKTNPTLATAYQSTSITQKEAEANAARIVKCVNMHDELVEALKEYVSSYDENKSQMRAMRMAKEILKKAEA